MNEAKVLIVGFVGFVFLAAIGAAIGAGFLFAIANSNLNFN